jgi:hypothetical protein
MPKLDPGSHACLFYETFEQQRQAVVPFFREGIENGEQCIYVAEPPALDDWYAEFQAAGIDVVSAIRNVSLVLCAGENWRLPGDFNSIVKAGQVWEIIENGFASFSGVRFAIDASWMLEARIPPDRICHWEATFNPLVAGDHEVRVLCQYNLNHHSAECIHSALRTHAVAVVGGRICENPYYDAPRILEREPYLNYSDADAGLIEGMLIHLATQPAPHA